MCGRYAAAEDPNQLKEFFGTVDSVVETLPANYNVAPTQPIYVVDDVSGARNLRVVSWGLVPPWARDISIQSKTINARSDTIMEKPSFRGAFARTRCLVPATGWYEWCTTKPGKQPYFIHRNDGNVAALAGLMEAWRSPESGQWFRTACIITTDASDDVAYIHDRMPVILERDQWANWLDPNQGSTEASRLQLHRLLRPAQVGTVASHPVATTVNSIRNNGPQLIEEVPAIV